MQSTSDIPTHSAARKRHHEIFVTSVRHSLRHSSPVSAVAVTTAFVFPSLLSLRGISSLLSNPSLHFTLLHSLYSALQAGFGVMALCQVVPFTGGIIGCWSVSLRRTCLIAVPPVGPIPNAQCPACRAVYPVGRTPEPLPSSMTRQTRGRTIALFGRLHCR